MIWLAVLWGVWRHSLLMMTKKVWIGDGRWLFAKEANHSRRWGFRSLVVVITFWANIYPFYANSLMLNFVESHLLRARMRQWSLKSFVPHSSRQMSTRSRTIQIRIV